MPTVAITIPETDQSVSRPIIIDVVSQLQEITKIDKNVKILFPGDMGVQQAHGTSIDEQGRWAEYPNGRYLQIEAIETMDEDLLLTNAVTQLQHLPVFADEALGLYIKPSYTTTNVTINFKYRTSSKTDALRWREDVMLRSAQGRQFNLHKLHYHYVIPREFLMLVKEIHGYREAVAPYGQTLMQYMQPHLSKRVSEVANLTKTHTELAVTETQKRVVGMFDFSGTVEKPEKDTDNGSWTISFAYKFRYERPTACVITYPIMVHNQLIPAKYIDLNDNAYDPDDEDNSYTLSGSAMQIFEAQQQLFKVRSGINGVIMIPKGDEFIPELVAPGTKSIIFALCQVDPDFKTLLNLKELGDITIDKDILSFISQSEYAYLDKPNESVYRLELYRGKNLASATSISCDANLNVSATNVLDLRMQHRVRLSVVTDFTKLTNGAIARLRANPAAFIKTITEVMPSLSTLPGLSAMLATPVVSNINWNVVYNLITGTVYTGTITYSELLLQQAKLNLAERIATNTLISSAIITPYQTPIKVRVGGGLNSNGVWVSDSLITLDPIGNQSFNSNPIIYDPLNVFKSIDLKQINNDNLTSLRTVMTSSVIALKR